MMLVPMVQNLDNIDAVRIVRLPTQLTTAADDSAPPAYVARAVMDETQQVRLIAIESPRLTTQVRSVENVGVSDIGDQVNDDNLSGDDD
ncbi:MAG: hypothetical protein AAF802_26530, partial [Planctomycetota bacterium]